MMRRALAFRKPATTGAGAFCAPKSSFDRRSSQGSGDEVERTTYSIGTGDALFSEVHAQCMRRKN
jgi:hypothetical protein